MPQARSPCLALPVMSLCLPSAGGCVGAGAPPGLCLCLFFYLGLFLFGFSVSHYIKVFTSIFVLLQGKIICVSVDTVYTWEKVDSICLYSTIFQSTLRQSLYYSVEDLPRHSG